MSSWKYQVLHSGWIFCLRLPASPELLRGQKIPVIPHLCHPSGGLAAAYLAGIRLAVKVAGTKHVGADVGTIHLGAATLVVSDKGDQCLPQGAGIATHICGVLHSQDGWACHLHPPPAHWWGLPPLTLIHVTPACNLTLVSSREGAACLRQADGLNKLRTDSAALPFLLQPDQDWAGERPRKQKSIAGSPIKWVGGR